MRPFADSVCTMLTLGKERALGSSQGRWRVILAALHLSGQCTLLAEGEVQGRGTSIPEEGDVVLTIQNMAQIKISFLDGWHLDLALKKEEGAKSIPVKGNSR